MESCLYLLLGDSFYFEGHYLWYNRTLLTLGCINNSTPTFSNESFVTWWALQKPVSNLGLHFLHFEQFLSKPCSSSATKCSSPLLQHLRKHNLDFKESASRSCVTAIRYIASSHQNSPIELHFTGPSVVCMTLWTAKGEYNMLCIMSREHHKTSNKHYSWNVASYPGFLSPLSANSKGGGRIEDTRPVWGEVQWGLKLFLITTTAQLWQNTVLPVFILKAEPSRQTNTA